MYRLDRDTAIIDTPGFQSFGLFHLTEDQIGEAMPRVPAVPRHVQVQRLRAPATSPVARSSRPPTKGKITAERLSFYQVLIEQHRELHEQHPDWKRVGGRS